jgi:hypothetical protein
LLPFDAQRQIPVELADHLQKYVFFTGCMNQLGLIYTTIGMPHSFFFICGKSLAGIQGGKMIDG